MPTHIRADMGLVRYLVPSAFVLGLALGVLTAPAASAQDVPATAFRVNWQPRDGGGVPTIEGRVHNDSTYRVTDVRVQIDALDANGALVARRDAWALGDIGPGGESTFVVERFKGAANYQMAVVSFHVVSRAPVPSIGQGDRGRVEAP